MNTRSAVFFVIAFIFVGLSSCKKINESTTLGGDIIPGVDGVNTFDTTLSVTTFNKLFAATEDSVYSFSTELFFLGNITSDPFFGKTNARIFLELKPVLYPWLFSAINNPDSLFLDSVVLVLGWKNTYGDTTAPQRVKVFEVDQSSDFRRDSFYLMRDQPFTYSNLLGTKDFFPTQLDDSVKAFRDTTKNQLRIRLNDNFGRRLLNYDTVNAYRSDSAFRTNFKGFALEADASFGDALMGFKMQDEPNTKLAIYYRFQKEGKIDTTVVYFVFSGLSAYHNHVDRFNFAGTPLKTASDDPGADDLLYLINAPGSYVNVEIPAINSLDNRIIHRAELIVEEVYDVSDRKFPPPTAILFDAYDTSLKAYKLIPYDFVPDASGVNQTQFGMFGKNTADQSGNPIRTWRFNITRYVQNVLTKQEALHRLRLISHRSVFNYTQISNATNSGGFVQSAFSVNENFVIGRVRVGGGNHPTQRMRLRLIYSKI